MVLVAEIFAVVVATTGLCWAIVLLVRRKKDGIPWAEFQKIGWKNVGFGFLSSIAAVTDLLLLLTDYAGAFEGMIGLVGTVALFYAVSRVDLNDFFYQLGNIGAKGEK